VASDLLRASVAAVAFSIWQRALLASLNNAMAIGLQRSHQYHISATTAELILAAY